MRARSHLFQGTLVATVAALTSTVLTTAGFALVGQMKSQPFPQPFQMQQEGKRPPMDGTMGQKFPEDMNGGFQGDRKTMDFKDMENRPFDPAMHGGPNMQKQQDGTMNRGGETSEQNQRPPQGQAGEQRMPAFDGPKTDSNLDRLLNMNFGMDTDDEELTPEQVVKLKAQKAKLEKSLKKAEKDLAKMEKKLEKEIAKMQKKLAKAKTDEQKEEIQAYIDELPTKEDIADMHAERLDAIQETIDEIDEYLGGASTVSDDE